MFLTVNFRETPSPWARPARGQTGTGCRLARTRVESGYIPTTLRRAPRQLAGANPGAASSVGRSDGACRPPVKSRRANRWPATLGARRVYLGHAETGAIGERPPAGLAHHTGRAH